MKEIQTGKTRAVFVEVPTNSYGFEIKPTSEGKVDQLHYHLNISGLYGTNQRLELLPPGSWQIVGKSNELTEDQQLLLAEKGAYQTFLWLNDIPDNSLVLIES